VLSRYQTLRKVYPQQKLKSDTDSFIFNKAIRPILNANNSFKLKVASVDALSCPFSINSLTPVIKPEENQVELRKKKVDSKKSAKSVEEKTCPLVRKKKMALDANGVPIAKIRWYCPPKPIWKPTLEVNKKLFILKWH
jgi:hypothetical protein